MWRWRRLAIALSKYARGQSVCFIAENRPLLETSSGGSPRTSNLVRHQGLWYVLFFLVIWKYSVDEGKEVVPLSN